MTRLTRKLTACALGGALLAAPFAAGAQSVNQNYIGSNAPQAYQDAANPQGDYVVRGVTLNARSGPGTGYSAVRTFAPGTVLYELDRQGNWVQVVPTPNANPLWVSASYLSPVTAPRVVTPRPLDQGRPYDGPYPLVIQNN
ncbi:SH3 domain-containing protein [Celeribacter indicus]|uniref:N-acetylmuramoyl-L-alanine amidase n=1 Tax=Celeribacter indicus TaxID=1208324 RepID=A0A0B5DUA8_9RHOB|nr:SH3 domain-containing protein [Celeribacter indicus]AJE47033.1 N-acetylmuramoyl-L-alanine amidase [Celeribacter indicus]SDW92493.1 SH3 domain-containing protein [Celeribacter indicus]